jgi:hypothetical protein
MTEVFSAERIDPGGLDAQKKAALSEALYAVHRMVFDGLDQDAFDHYVVNSPAQRTRILLYRNRQNELVGYFGVHRFEMEVAGEPLVVFRGEVGLLPAYRQKDANLSFWWTEAARFKLLHPRKRVYFFFVPVSPSFYAMVARRTHTAYPGRNRNVPADRLRLMTQLAPQLLVMDFYGPRVPIGGGALSGKHLSHIDRIGAYAARDAAVRAVQSGAKECLVRVAYAPNRDQPLDIDYAMEGRGERQTPEFFVHPEMVARYPASLITTDRARGLHFLDQRLPWNGGCEGQSGPLALDACA